VLECRYYICSSVQYTAYLVDLPGVNRSSFGIEEEPLPARGRDGRGDVSFEAAFGEFSLSGSIWTGMRWEMGGVSAGC
jgi:hypothetical protein